MHMMICKELQRVFIPIVIDKRRVNCHEPPVPKENDHSVASDHKIQHTVDTRWHTSVQNPPNPSGEKYYTSQAVLVRHPSKRD
jgi:hypothetical protein